jgi:hypothetical protein
MTEQPPSFSLVAGGPFYRLMSRLGVVRGDRRDATRLSALLVAGTWFPLLATAVASKVVSGRFPSQFLDYATHVRLLVGIPLLFVGEQSVAMRTERCIDRFLIGRWAEEGEEAVRRIVAAATRWRDAAPPEILSLLLALLGGQAVMRGSLEHLGIMRDRAIEPGASGLAAFTWWFGLVALPVYQFLVYRWLWRWVIWSRVLWSLSRLRIRPLATHPDRQGGLGFLSEPAVGFRFVILAMSSVQAAVWANQTLFGHVSVQSFKSALALNLVAMLTLALGPLLVFCGVLWRARFGAVRDYGHLGLDLVRAFDRRWIGRTDREGLLGNPDQSSVTDFGTTYEVIRQMRLVPFGPREMAVLAASVLLPMIPLALLQVSVLQLAGKLWGVMIGGLPP